ncbi:MAG: chemotaxis protein CheB [Roseinatronobacter sp.]
MRAQAPPDPARPGRAAETVVALGASAGGLDALERFFSTIDAGLDAAFVVIQHLAPHHRTMMDSLLARHTAMPVRVAAEGDHLLAGHVYVIPAGVTMTLGDNRLHLDPRPATGMRFPIDSFFHSMALSDGARIIAVVLSGTGSDGSEGLSSVTDAGGWALVQSPASAGFDGMPISALATGLAHDSGTPEELARFIEAVITEHRVPRLVAAQDDDEVPMQTMLAQISARIGIDLGNYKPHTLLRRLERRMLAAGHRSPRSYMAALQNDTEEAGRLRREMMIPVTSFFRDQDAFDALRDLVILPALQTLQGDATARYRIWSVACSTGQEAYSLGIVVLEAMRALGLQLDLKIIATDIEPSYLALAATGVYPARLVETLPQDLRTRYFAQVADGDYQVCPRLRRTIVFSRHDVLSDPPFLNLDLIVCRNMIIYLQAGPQERALRRMLFGLKGGGVLFMGGSEAPGKLAAQFDTISGRSKLYRLRTALRHLPAEDVLMSAAKRPARQDYRQAPAPPHPLRDATPMLSPAATCLITAFAPPSVVIDAHREIRHVYGDVMPFLRLPPGEVSLDLIALLPAKVGAVVSTLILSAIRARVPVKSVIVHPDGDTQFGAGLPVRVAVRPVSVPGHETPAQFIVSFETLSAQDEAPPGADAQEPGMFGVTRVAAEDPVPDSDVQDELGHLREVLRTTIEDLGSANEDLQVSNEELMAANEELQSTNEELQSVNEELHSVNAELQEKILQLNEAYADLDGLSQAARIPLIFLDGYGRITRFSAQATEIFRLRDTDFGRPLMDITHTLQGFDLERAIAGAQARQSTVQQEIMDRDNRSWLVTIQPFVGRSSEEARIVLSFIDVSSVQKMRYLQAVIDAAPQNLAVLDVSGRIVLVNDAWRGFAQDNGGPNALGRGNSVNYLSTLGQAAQHDRTARQALEGLQAILSGRKTEFSLIYPCHSPTQKRWFMMHAAPLRDGGCVVTHLDISDIALPQDEEEASA